MVAGAGVIVGAAVSMLFTAYAVHLLVDALRSGCAPVLPVGRYRRASNPFNYWLAILCLVVFAYMGVFTLVQLLRDLPLAG